MFALLSAVALGLAQPTQQWNPGGQNAWTAEAIHDGGAAVRLERLARRGDVPAMRDYGLLLWKGQGVHRDREAAVSWFYEAALRNDPPSMYILGRAFERGEGVGKDLKLADYWTARAFRAGDKDAER